MSNTTAAALADLLTKLAPDPDQPDGVDGEWRYASLVEGALDAGVWTASVAAWDETDYAVEEVVVMIDGHLRLTDADGTVHDLRRGDAFHLPKGWAGRWEVLEDMRKFYVILP